ncbi:hypothetical protein EJV46_12680 [Roseococcus sp. SYP-B2431]|uniref:hypothetical protein n=1 Tax=Roseococcus sp. SYP-B2431 TaxID=2496640 RepID=UPI00103C1DF8|nr:hypothetical protein [Roseococcus sp. SYP-B2431]TCH98055.1 hypothetical protein EJV46_12680 [Roseococcus sp. SYP-B2431]
MHTMLLIGGGLVLLAGMAVAGRAIGQPATTLRLFLLIWLIATAANMWIGVSRAGYTVAQELPLAAVAFGVPALAALALLRILRP